MKRMNLGKTLSTVLAIGGAIVAASASAQMQGGYGMMDGNSGGWMGGYGGGWVVIVLVAVVAGLVGWIVGQRKK